MAIAIDTVSGLAATAPANLTFAHTVAAGGVLVVFAGALGDTPTVTGVTYDGVALTQLLATTDDSDGVVAKNSAWIIHNPTTGVSRNIIVTYSAAGAGYGAAHGISYTGVVSTSAAATHRTIYHAGAGGGGANVTVVDSVSGDLVVASCANYNGTISAGAGITSRRFDNAIDGGAYGYGLEDVAAAGASTVMSFTADDFCTNIAFALIPSVGSTVVTPSRLRWQTQILRLARSFSVVASRMRWQDGTLRTGAWTVLPARLQWQVQSQTQRRSGGRRGYTLGVQRGYPRRQAVLITR